MILVTGGTGFLGSALVEQLSKNDDIRLITRQDLSGNVVRGTISDYETVEKAMRGVDVVYHLATESDHYAPYEDHYATTILGTHNILEAAVRLGVKKVVHMSTSAVTVEPKTNYSRAKAEAEHMVREYWDELTIPVIRAPLIYDVQVIKKLRRMSYLPFPYKKQLIHLVYKDSVIQALISAMEQGGSEIYTIADKVPILLTTLYKELARPRPMLFVPPQVIWLGQMLAYPIEAAAKLLRIRPPITPQFIKYAFQDRSFDIRLSVEKLKYEPVDTIDMIRKLKSVKHPDQLF